MPIADWFKAREERRYTPTRDPSEAADLPDGVWVKCDACKKVLYQGDLDENLQVCPYCADHGAVEARERIEHLVDPGSFTEIDAGLGSADPLHFDAGKPYAQGLVDAVERTGLTEAIVTGRAFIEGIPVVIGVMDFRFIGASMGSAVGEKVARAAEAALADRVPLIMITSSGGARMQEGMLSLMQMAKTSAAVARMRDEGVPYVSVLTDPTMGGVTASFATLSDIVLAEPGARVGFAGPALVEQTIRKVLPSGFQTSEKMLSHGMVDAIVDRRDLREALGLLLAYLTGAPPGGVDRS